jgi:hypothetical protein
VLPFRTRNGSVGLIIIRPPVYAGMDIDHDPEKDLAKHRLSLALGPDPYVADSLLAR